MISSRKLCACSIVRIEEGIKQAVVIKKLTVLSQISISIKLFMIGKEGQAINKVNTLHIPQLGSMKYPVQEEGLPG